MAYLDKTTPRNRATAIIGVGAVHAALAAVLVAGLAVKFERKIDPPVHGIQLPPAPPPPPPPQPTRAQPTKAVVAPLPPVPQPLPSNNSVAVDSVTPLSIPSASSTIVDPLPLVAPSPTPSATFAPKDALPLGDTSRWITTDDYPARALRSGQAGVVRYRAAVGSDGRVTGCEVTTSSRSADLDAATCRLIRLRARFAPATDPSGARVAGTFSGTVSWQIPD